MSVAAPPQQPNQVVVHDDGSRRIYFRLWQVMLTLITVLVTAWFCTLMNWSSPLGALPGLVALMIAKHVLVAILMQGTDYHLGEKDRSSLARPGRNDESQITGDERMTKNE